LRKLSVPFAAIVSATLAIVTTGCQAVASSPAGKLPADQRSVADLAIDALSAELEIPRERIVVESVAEIDWRDSSLGCSKPGMAYLQVITPGHKVTLRADGQAYAVHEAQGRAFVCNQAALPKGIVDDKQLPFGHQMLAAQQDLAKRLNVQVREIRPAGAQRMTWGDASLGCPEAGFHYAQVVTEGWVLTLRHGGRDYTYHADTHHAIPCPAIPTE
jgi:hypothetical protein